jgi:CelD/BcsL family acetyltransferase involved in cellulose biosynthesis
VTGVQAPTYSVVSSLDELEALSPEWDSLVLAMARPSPFLLHGWVAEWWRSFGDGCELAVATATREGKLVGALPVYVSRRRGLRVCQFLGAHESALGDLILGPAEPVETAAGLVVALRAQRYDYCDLFGLPDGSVLAEASAGALSLIQRVEAPVLLMPDGFEAAYTAKTSSKKRNLHRRRLRQLAEVGEVEFVEAQTAEKLEPLLEEAFELHRLRWEGRPDGSTFGTEQGRSFQRAAARRLGDSGVLRMVLMRVGGKPAAFHYFFELGSTMYVHRLAFDPMLSRYSPGLVSTLETLRVASDNGMTKVEYLGGGERYKLELSDRLEPLQQAVGLSRNPAGALAARLRVASIGARKTLKRSARLQRLYLAGGLRRHGRSGAGTAEEGH